MSEAASYTLISPKQFKDRMSESLCTPIGINAVYDLVKRKDFPSVKIGKQYYVIEGKIYEWMEKQSARRKD